MKQGSKTRNYTCSDNLFVHKKSKGVILNMTIKTACKRGHPYPEYLYVSPKGVARCRECHRIHGRERTRRINMSKPVPEFCKRGHRWSENLYRTKAGSRCCRECSRISNLGRRMQKNYTSECLFGHQMQNLPGQDSQVRGLQVCHHENCGALHLDIDRIAHQNPDICKSSNLKIVLVFSVDDGPGRAFLDAEIGLKELIKIGLAERDADVFGLLESNRRRK